MNGHVNSRDPALDPSIPTPVQNEAPPHVPSPAANPETADTTMDEEIRPDHYFDGGKVPVFRPVSPRLIAQGTAISASTHSANRC